MTDATLSSAVGAFLLERGSVVCTLCHAHVEVNTPRGTGEGYFTCVGTIGGGGVVVGCIVHIVCLACYATLGPEAVHARCQEVFRTAVPPA